MNKKAIELTTSTIVVFALLLIVLVTMIWIFQTYIGKETDIIGEQIESLEDCDCDDVRNFMDKCPCIPGQEDGCPEGQGASKCSKQECNSAKAQFCNE